MAEIDIPHLCSKIDHPQKMCGNLSDAYNIQGNFYRRPFQVILLKLTTVWVSDSCPEFGGEGELVDLKIESPIE